MAMLFDSVALCLLGLAVGWMAGLSVSPVLQTILTSVLAVAGPLLATLVGIKLPSEEESKAEKETSGAKSELLSSGLSTLTRVVQSQDKVRSTLEKLKMTTWPLTCFVVFMAIGSSLGLLARTNELLGVRPGWVLNRWAVGEGNLGVGAKGQQPQAASKDPCADALNDECVRRRLFDNVYPAARRDADEKSEKTNASASASTKINKDGKQEMQLSVTHVGALVDSAGGQNPLSCKDLLKTKAIPGNTATINDALRELHVGTCSGLDTPGGVKNCEALIQRVCR